MTTKRSGPITTQPSDPPKPVSHRMLVRCDSSIVRPSSASRTALTRARRSDDGMSGRTSTCQRTGDGTNREVVTGAAEAGDRAGGDRRDDARVPPRFAGVRVGEVNLDDRPVERGERVMKAPRVVRERAGVDDDRGAAAPGAVDQIEQLALVIGLVVL